MELSWGVFKTFVNTVKLNIFYLEPSDKEYYHVFTLYGSAFIETFLNKGSTEAVEFEDAYKDSANVPEAPRTRITTNKLGRKMHMRYVTFTTSSQDNYDNTDWADQDFGDVTYTMKNASGETTQDEILCKETWLDWEPSYDYEIAGGGMYVPGSLASRNFNISELCQSGGSATGTASGHNLKVKSVIVISGSDQENYNGTKTIMAVPDSDHFVFNINSETVSPATGIFSAVEGDDAWEAHVVAVPDLPPAYGGQLAFLANPRIKWIKNEFMEIDSAINPAELAYSAVYHSNKIRIIVKHPVGAKTEFQFRLKIYKD